MTHSHEHGPDGRGQHGPVHPGHPGAAASAEPGGYDEYDHPDPSVRGESTDGDVNTEAVNEGAAAPDPSAGAPVVSDGTAAEGDSAEAVREFGPAAEAHPDSVLAAERLEDLRRLQAEYVNYKKRVDRDRSLAREQGITHVLESMLPVLDEIHLAREHGDLADGPAATIVEKLDAVLAKLGIERFGSLGDEFDPAQHEALMRMDSDLPEGALTTTVVKVLQPGYRLGERLVRVALVAVAEPA